MPKLRSVTSVVLAMSKTDGHDPPAGVVLHEPVPAPVQQPRGSPERIHAALGKLARTWTFIVNPVTPEDTSKTRSISLLELSPGIPPVATDVSVPPVTVPTVRTSAMFTALFEFVGRTVCRVEVPE